MFKTKNNVGPAFMKNIFMEKDDQRYSLRNKEQFESRNIRTVHRGEDTLRFLGCKIWKIIPDNIKQSQSVEQFKRFIRQWVPSDCPCRLCKTYVQHIGYINR